ncbi:MAG: heavy-metal-associated domain-containing protein [Cyclobacteriaceae bacterium]|jgi:copper chaperone CopZ|nr:heavy-metal-associated domain-containing protein [Cyclobacteriaceae bacterium]
METMKFKTNIKCAACVAKVTSSLNETAGENKWAVDLTDPARILTISDSQDDQKIVEALQKVGYKAEKV